MGVSVLPDRERRHLLQFHVAPSLEYRTRLVAAAALILAGFAAQLAWPNPSSPAALLVSLPLILAGNALLLIKGYNLRPGHSVQRGEWERTTRDRFQATRDFEQSVRRWDETAWDITCKTGFASLALIAIVVGAVHVLLVGRHSTQPWADVFVLDAAVLIVPHWLTGLRRAWRPVALRQQIDALETALGAVEHYDDPSCQVQPMFEMSGSGAERTPVGARVLIRFPDGPESFLGLQLQVALNDVQGTKYPYLYAVIVARPSFDLHGRFTRIRSHLERSKITMEKKSEGEVDVVVIRQHTTRRSGYHTKDKAVRSIARTAWLIAADLLADAERSR